MPCADQKFSEADDLVVINLNPSDKYKSSVLAGLHPEFILEIASRGLAFWTYQMSQEMDFRDAVEAQYREKLQQVEAHMATTTLQAKTEIELCEERLSCLQKEFELEKRKTYDLTDQCGERDRRIRQLQSSNEGFKQQLSTVSLQRLTHRASVAPNALGMSPVDNSGRGINAHLVHVSPVATVTLTLEFASICSGIYSFVIAMASFVDANKLTLLLHECVPTLDQPIVDYIVAYIPESTANGSGKTPLYYDLTEDEITGSVEPSVRAILESAGGSKSKIDKVCKALRQMLLDRLHSRAEGAGGVGRPQLVKLDRPVYIMSQTAMAQSARFGNIEGNVDLASLRGKKVASQVDIEKLKKAEAKIKAKMEKRSRRAAYEASRLIEDPQKNFEEDELSILKVNPIMDYTSTKSQSKDIKVERFDISFAGKRILTDTTLTLAFGRRYGLIGRNGIGKSTLLRAISRRELEIPTHISILHVEQEMAGDDTTAIRSVLKADIWREHLLKEEKLILDQIKAAEIEPDPNASDDANHSKDALSTQLTEVYRKLQEIESDKAEAKAASILAGLGFHQADLERPTKSFSGGWRMRLSLARALFCRPDLLLLDEPTNMLDIPAVVWLEQYLRKWPSTLLVVSHDREFLDEVATDIMHQHSEKLDYYKGNFSMFHGTKEERRKNQIREYESQLQYRQHLQDFIDRWRYNAKRAAQAQSKIKILEKLPVLEAPEDEAVVTFRFPDPEALSPPILQMDEVGFGYTPEKRILSGVNIDMQMNSRIAVVGPNGAGKSTMLKLLIGKLDPVTGMVHRHGRLRIAYFTQHHVDQLDMDLSPVAYMAKAFPGRSEQEYRAQLGAFGISGMTGLQTIQTLSGGQKSRVAFACLAIQQPQMLILDEPTNHLDMDSIDALTKALRDFDGGVVVVSHDERFINAVTEELWVCDGGALHKFMGNGIKDYKAQICPPDSVVV
ncbi:ATP-binding cassette, regulator of translational elongation [Dimargaris verticillata]|uniref:ATP-binding cassette, regulator of translational elongation n=1 Tax=Dimargaris verticillata TaxID=2761393 RepID=A0A9W8B0G6_9FUNG|nr:ATP-binding cassette, regulator of translational elongation [Dimargaris verticillata]